MALCHVLGLPVKCLPYLVNAPPALIRVEHEGGQSLVTLMFHKGQL